ncbi:hypothetical protein [Acetonema longum]|uniref:Uncharacterized protein n=1 Tax=Acetonema longum DSM 6540 TaxID=1009370 RepID=F7NES7_9FIRM|nr:hypothetical protein [Acetonema longum]EGO65488.1 hypothetical protein ALO_02711 [Acetonema longum DSM 6540]
MLKKLLKTVSSRLLPSIDNRQDGTGHCHEAAFDPDSFPEAVKQQLRKNQDREKPGAGGSNNTG